MIVETLGIHELWLFILSGLLLNITPGPDTAYIIGRSIQMGWRGGAAAAIGIGCGCLVHVFGAAIGLSAISEFPGAGMQTGAGWRMTNTLNYALAGVLALGLLAVGLAVMVW